MKQLKNLENVNALALPANVLVLLSKYAQRLKSTNGTVIKLSSLRVFIHVHKTCIQAEDSGLNAIYHTLLNEVNLHIQAGTMYTNEQKKMLLGKNKNKERALRKYLPKSKTTMLNASHRPSEASGF